MWAIRCLHEATLHDHNVFITLTYDPEHLPPGASLDKTHFQKFMKRFRKRHGGALIRYYQCGEYGDQTGRPHYHAIIFGYDFPDKTLLTSKPGHRLYISQELTTLWKLGFAVIGAVTFESAAYVARYCVKKINGKQAEQHYQRIDDDGNTIQIEPEYSTMSRRPGIASAWYDKYKTDVFPKDYIRLPSRDGIKVKPPRFYADRLKNQDAKAWEIIADKRQLAIIESTRYNPERLAAEEQIVKAQLNLRRKPL